MGDSQAQTKRHSCVIIGALGEEFNSEEVALMPLNLTRYR
jgi:hypothetical protein